MLFWIKIQIHKANELTYFHISLAQIMAAEKKF